MYKIKHTFTLEEITSIVKHYSIETWHHHAVLAPDWDVQEIAACIYFSCLKYDVDPLLALAQGIVESHFGVAPSAKRSRRTKNIYNVGNVDSGADEHHPSWGAGIQRYCSLMAGEYNWNPPGPVTLEMMLSHDFRRPRGGRYASAPKYTKDISNIASKILRYIAKEK